MPVSWLSHTTVPVGQCKVACPSVAYWPAAVGLPGKLGSPGQWKPLERLGRQERADFCVDRLVFGAVGLALFDEVELDGAAAPGQ
jgi:hypothetical protein